ncbi:hypothetical protein IU485_27830 [Nocardia cyriacigeorgica]|uniref:hypothetical protein n=1 Tax=Nocardia cyriacigeorgica TaxID=135487 RepID=UPI00189373B5|nr:hypothetical protein [Nocardia cyriacigeorgica]MBF6085188.1 hypothetical protein [Nocardia cyriacigeorgica]
MGNAGRLLVVDWDYFFPNPAMMHEVTDVTAMYDWGQREALFLIHEIWQSRATTFWAHDLELPLCRGYEGFWDRFDLSQAGLMLTCDSNSVAGAVPPSLTGLEAEGWDEVWLFDAHHDCGYSEAQAQMFGAGQYDCGMWMMVHQQRGSRLHVRYPQWRASADGSTFEDVESPPLVEVDRQLDDGQVFDQPWDAVVVCRSGAWVPSWCDHQFDEFIEAAPLSALWVDSNVEPGPRVQPDRAAARREINNIQRLIQGLA